MDKPTILVQLDTDPHPSVFDGVVAVDAGVAHLFRHGGVNPKNVRELVHGAMFTRGGDDLRQTALFVGGSNVHAGELLLEAVQKAFFGPVRVSVLFDANGANTTAAAAVLAAAKHLDLSQTTALVLGGTGPVGQRVARLLAGQGATVRLASRDVQRAHDASAAIHTKLPTAKIVPTGTFPLDSLYKAVKGVQLIVAAGAAGALLLPADTLADATDAKVVIDLNAVPPLGVEGIKVTDRAAERNGVLFYGAIGVGNTKMKIHKAALKKIFTANDLVLDAEEIFALGQELQL